MLPADYYNVSPESPHWPLVIMLVLTQLSVGGFIAAVSLEYTLPQNLWEIFRPFQAMCALVAGLLALGASTFHLGRPLYAFRAVLGLRHSWLSREIIAFGLFSKLAIIYAGISVFVGSVSWLPVQILSPLAWVVSISGVVALFCSAMIYIFTQREFWSPGQTGMKFFLTTGILGAASIWLSLLVMAWIKPGFLIEPIYDAAGPLCAQWLIGFSTIKLVWEASFFMHLFDRQVSSLKRSALLMTRQLKLITLARFFAGALGGIVMPLFLLQGSLETSQETTPLFFIAVVILVFACLIGELLERYLYFAAVASPRMPGGIR